MSRLVLPLLLAAAATVVTQVVLYSKFSGGYLVFVNQTVPLSSCNYYMQTPWGPYGPFCGPINITVPKAVFDFFTKDKQTLYVHKDCVTIEDIYASCDVVKYRCVNVSSDMIRVEAVLVCR